VPEPITGEVLAFQRITWWFIIGGMGASGLSYLGLGSVFLLGAVLGNEPRVLLVTLATWSLGAFYLGMLRYVLRHKPRLVLGYDRMQLLFGRKVFQEVPYANIAEIAVATGWMLFVRVLFVGIRLSRPESFDAAWPRRARARRWCRRCLGFDMAFRDIHLDEPLERCRETMLVFYHRFLADRESRP
jgi:hypothetical protein